jgi:hypothetical protein
MTGNAASSSTLMTGTAASSSTEMTGNAASSSTEMPVLLQAQALNTRYNPTKILKTSDDSYCRTCQRYQQDVQF